jgi:hypothetical protein
VSRPLRLRPILLILLMATASCFGSPGSQAACEPDTSALLLFDVSRSTVNPEVREGYLEDFDKVMESASDRWEVGADRIDENPLAHSEFPVDVCIPAFDAFEGDPLTHEEQVQRIRQDARAAVEDLLALDGESVRGTAIMDSLHLAERFFASYPEAEKRYLLIFSDMVEVSDTYRFTPRNLRPADVAEFIESQREKGQLPDLTSVEAYVVGAGATAGGGVEGERFRAIQGFWLAYFEATGANLPEFRYGSALVRFP